MQRKDANRKKEKENNIKGDGSGDIPRVGMSGELQTFQSIM